jgi:hypothetical protein
MQMLNGPVALDYDKRKGEKLCIVFNEFLKINQILK